ncbi:MAG: PAS domain S-box protein, partial [Spirulinaceae cyanobacterium]
ESVVVCANDAVLITEARPISEPGPKIVYVNEAFTRMTGYTTQEVLGKTPRILQGEKTNRRQLNKIRTAIAQLQSIQIELINYHKNGKEFWVELSIVPIADEKGCYTHLLSIQRDISDRKKAETALRDSEARNQALLNAIPDLMFRLDRQGTFLDFRAKAKDLLMKPEEIIGTNIADSSMPPPVVSVVKTAIYQALATGEVQSIDYSLPLPDKLHHYEARLAESGLDEVVAMVRDITERKQVEEKLRENHQFIQRIADTTPGILYIYDLKKQKNVYVNRSVDDFLGYPTLNEQQKRLSKKLFHPEDFSKIHQHFKYLDSSPDQTIAEIEYRMLAADGEWRWFNSRNTVFTRNIDGKLKQIVGVAQDVTDHKIAQEMSLALEKEKELSKLQLRFFSMVSHEFRTPLSTILMSAQILEHNTAEKLTAKTLRNLHRIQTSVKHLLHLLEDLLTINRAESGKLEFNSEKIVLEDFVFQLIEDIQLANNHKFQFEVNNSCRDYLTYLDCKLLRFILANLISNALKYSPGDYTSRLEVFCQDKLAIFRIRDRGIGIPAEDISKLFEPFRRGKNVGILPGSGLGLTVVKKCIDLHGGTIEVESEVGVGTIVTVKLPLIYSRE